MVLGLFGDFETEPRLSGATVYLRAPRRRDWREWAELRAVSRAHLVPWEPVWPDDALSRAAYRRRLQRLNEERARDQGHGYLIFRRGDDAMLGGIGLSAIRRGVAQIGAVGYWIGLPYARQGYMTDALRTLIGFAFLDLALHRLEAACQPDNLPSQALLRACGFREEGRARGYLRINGAWRDHLLFARLVDDVARVRFDSGALPL